MEGGENRNLEGEFLYWGVKRGEGAGYCVCDILFIIKFYGCMVYMSMSEYCVIIVAVADIFW